LTVSREAAKAAVEAAAREKDVVIVLQKLVDAAKEALARTPEQLPVLKQVGVVDAGGQGLIFIYEGFTQALGDPQAAQRLAKDAASRVAAPDAERLPAHRSAQSHIATEDIHYGYCTEFIIKLSPEGQARFTEDAFRGELGKHGDSMVVVADDDLVKVHIHAEYPGNVMNHAMQFGSLTRIKIENMREQHTEILALDAHGGKDGQNARVKEQPGTVETPAPPAEAEQTQRKAMGIVAVAAGEGLSEVFRSIGVDVMLSGGQTMNPSTEDILNAVGSVPADTVFVLPNNSNIVLAAEQAKELAGQKVVVVPTKTIPQGLAAALAFREDENPETNAERMLEAARRVRSGSVTYAVRDSAIGGYAIKEGDYLAMLDSEIVANGPELSRVIRQLIDRMVTDGDEIVTVFTGQDAAEEETGKLEAYLVEKFPDAELEIHDGGQPLYSYLISVE